MTNPRDLAEQEYKILYKAADELYENKKTDITCPICDGKLERIGTYSSYAILCENCGELFSLRGI